MSSATSSSIDDNLVARVQSGDLKSFGELMRRYNQRLFRAARAVVGTDAEAEDIVQEAYVRAYCALPGYRPGAFGSWILTIVLNEARTRLRTSRRRDAILRDNEPLDSPEANAPEHAVEGQRLRAILERAIDTLPDDYRLVFVLRELEQLSTRETATHIGITEIAVRTRLHRAKAALRELISDHIGRELAEAFSFAGERCNRITRNVLAILQRQADLTH